MTDVAGAIITEARRKCEALTDVELRQRLAELTPPHDETERVEYHAVMDAMLYRGLL